MDTRRHQESGSSLEHKPKSTQWGYGIYQDDLPVQRPVVQSCTTVLQSCTMLSINHSTGRTYSYIAADVIATILYNTKERDTGHVCKPSTAPVSIEILRGVYSSATSFGLLLLHKSEVDHDLG